MKYLKYLSVYLIAIILAGFLCFGNLYLIHDLNKYYKTLISQEKENDNCYGAKSIFNQLCKNKSFGYINEDVKSVFQFDKTHKSGRNSHYIYPNKPKLEYYGDDSASYTILLWGDSHAMNLHEDFEYIADKLHMKLIIAYKSATVFNCVKSDQPCNDFYKYVASLLIPKVDFIVIRYLQQDDTEDLFRFKSEKPVIYIQDQPSINNVIGFDCVLFNYSKDCRAYKSLFKMNFSKFSANPRPNEHYILTEDLFCDNIYCYTNIGGLNVYSDGNHLTASYARSMNEILLNRIKPYLK